MAILPNSAQLSFHTFVTITHVKAQQIIHCCSSISTTLTQVPKIDNFLALNGSAIWYGLSDNAHTAPSLTSFRQRLKSHFLTWPSLLKSRFLSGVFVGVDLCYAHCYTRWPNTDA